MKKTFFYVALASLTLTTSCSQDDLQTSQASENEIQFHASMGLKSRAEETKITNLSSFYVTAFKDNDANYMQDVEYTPTTSGEVTTTTQWSHSGSDTYFWPVEGTLNFYAYAYGHNKTQTPLSSVGATVKIDKDNHKIENFKPATGTDGTDNNQADASKQEDLIYAVTTGTKADNSDGISLNFKHALSQISIKAMNTNKAYKVEVKGVKIGGVNDQGTFTFPTAGDETKTASWETSKSQDSNAGIYETSWTTSSTLGTTADEINTDDNVPFMLLPQTLNKQNTYSSGTYIALNITITMKSGVATDGSNIYEGQVIHNDWAYVGIGDSWDMGKHYTYTLDFSEGAGQDKDGNQIISGKEIGLDVAVTDWNDENKNINVFPDIANTPTEANCLIMNSPGKVYAINIASKINAFWMSEAAGNSKVQTAPITDATEWTAEVIWQDITNYVKAEKPTGYTQKRAIDFYDLSKGTQTTDTYTGTGKTLYIQLRNAYRGNIVVGVKNKNASENDGYLWSWHLWLTEDPKEICGFMDRNLGATLPFPTEENISSFDKNESYGVWYQYGRKDALCHDIHYYDINGDLINTWEEDQKKGYYPYKTTQASSIAEVVKSPLRFYISNGDWLANNSYTSYCWNDINQITTGTTKTFFDPCPDGWRLPTNDELKILNSDDFVYNSTYKGRIYKNLVLFPEPGYLHCGGSSDNTYQNQGNSGFIWSVDPKYSGSELDDDSKASDTKGAGFYFWSDENNKKGLNNTNRGDAVKIRCVRDTNK